MNPKLLKLIEFNKQDGFMKLQFLILGSFVVDGIFEASTGKVWLLGDSMAKQIGFPDFMEMIKNDTCLDFVTRIETKKHPVVGWLFRY